MTTSARARLLAEAAAGFPELAPPTAEDLLQTVRMELGHEKILDGFQPYGGHLAVAVPPRTILHVVSGNTPHAALQTILRGLLLGSHNFLKLPAGGLAEIESFCRALHAEMSARVEVSRELRAEWMEQADAWIVFGSDRTVEELRGKCPAGKMFQAHGHRVSFGVVFDDTDFASCDAAARDASLFEQQGCLSPHVFYVAGNPREWAGRLAAAMRRHCEQYPPPPAPPAVRAAIAGVRADFEFCAASNPGIQVWKSSGSTDWTVLFDPDAKFAVSPLHRVVFVKPLPENPAPHLAGVARWIGTIGVWPATPENAARLAPLGASRICPLGRMQRPPFSWHAESLQNLAPLVRWVDFEPGT